MPQKNMIQCNCTRMYPMYMHSTLKTIKVMSVKVMSDKIVLDHGNDDWYINGRLCLKKNIIWTIGKSPGGNFGNCNIVQQHCNFDAL